MDGEIGKHISEYWNVKKTKQNIYWNLPLTSLQAIGWMPLEIPGQGRDTIKGWFRKLRKEQLLVLKIWSK